MQPALAAASRHGLLDPTDATASYLSTVTGHPVTRAQVEKQLRNAVEFIDDALWCENTRTELALDDLTLEMVPQSGSVWVRLHPHGISDPLVDPRVPRLISATRRYRRSEHLSLFVAEGWKIVLRGGESVGYLPGQGSDVIDSDRALTDEVLGQLTASGGVLADLFP
jgi:hypothetical protein